MVRLARARDAGFCCMIAFGLIFAGVAAGGETNPNPQHVATSAQTPTPTLQSALLAIAHAEGSLSERDRRPTNSRAQDTAVIAAFTPTNVKSIAGAPPAPRNPGTEPFGLASEQAPEGPLWAKWRGLDADLRAEKAVIAQCRASPATCISPAAQRFLAIVETARARTGRARLGEVNRAVNLAIRQTSDLVQHGVPDRWTAPLATLAAGKGDCEDYAIAKYVALKETGVPEDDLRLMIVHDATVHEHHAVLAARLDGQWLVLDNRRMALIEDKDLKDLTPLFVLAPDGVQQIAKSAPHSREDGVAKVRPAKRPTIMGGLSPAVTAPSDAGSAGM